MKNRTKILWLLHFLILTIITISKAQITLNAKDKIQVYSRNEKTVNTAISTGVISRISSINLTSLFNDTRAEIKVAFNAGNSVFNIGLAQSFSEKPKTANLLDANGLNTGSTLSIAWQKMLGKPIIPTSPPIIAGGMAKFTSILEEFRAKKGIPAADAVTFLMLDSEFKNKVFNSGVIDLRAFETPWFFTFQFSASRVNFDYITDALATAPLSTKEINKNFTFSFSKFTSLDVYYSLSYSAIYAYKSGDEALSYSFPVGSAGVSYAKDVTVGCTSSNESGQKG